MIKFISRHLQFCPKTGRVIGFRRFRGFSQILLPFVGLAAIVWILIRVIPKPARLSYPCVRTAMPIAAGFIGYLSMVALSSIAFLRSKKPFRYYPVFLLGAFIIFGISGFYLTGSNINLKADANVTPNKPIGEAKGIFPGRVVWAHNPHAVDQNCDPASFGHAWYMSENNNQPVVDYMVSAAIDSLTGQKSDSAAWRSIFQYHNATRGKGKVNYHSGEKIFIKINSCSSWGGNFNTADLSKVNNAWYGMSETSPAIILAVLHQLVDIVHVAQSDIYIGDPMKHIYKHEYEQWHPRYPGVHYLDHDNYSGLGREQVKPSATAKIYYSDKGAILRPDVSYPGNPAGTTPILYDSLYTIFEDAEYILNIPQLKGHKRAGMTMFAKNHFGSQSRADAMHLHNGLPAPMEMQNDTSRLGYGLYRIQVDLMTQSLLRKKNLVFLMDALWGSDYEQDQPLRWQMAPFNNSFSASVFASFDNVAIESVGYDFLRSEFTIARGAGTFVQMRGVDDYLHQAADSTNWPKGIKYDPDRSGIHIYSLGVHEHWNNQTDKKYSRNLGTGNGIELIDIEQNNLTGIATQENPVQNSFKLCQNYPNPFKSSTKILYILPLESSVEISIYDMQGRIVKSFANIIQSSGYQTVEWDGTSNHGNMMSGGIYLYRVKAISVGSGIIFDKTAKMLLQK